MKAISITLLLVLCSVASIFAISEPLQHQQATQKLPPELIQLGVKINGVAILPVARDPRLRFERAQHYYQQAHKHLEQNWKKRAVEDANRGLSLLAMNEV
ncbi:MAG: hypothetical protein NWQ54_04595 [Paraglaciecola sp.]|uniref:hypothetical protein n=1 Tax=Pseudomonadati TaxID=3379134 RepID=UPI00273DE2D0|nr:hypothetical protein [Paraglaciecola sp.]MDP5030854.1 hypothetical protein [Paraglaciecola sp.]MDP5041181.1 hypothetical protein [Paraglaciecola sp.]MDP5130136.1 hypothetical protein [Paraglaciecola sp.]